MQENVMCVPYISVRYILLRLDECWVHGEDTLKCNTFFKKIASKHIADTTFLHLVVNFVSQCALSCILEFIKKGQHLF